MTLLAIVPRLASTAMPARNIVLRVPAAAALPVIVLLLMAMCEPSTRGRFSELPATLTEISDQSGATLADVIDFTNAYNATGHIEMEPVVAAPVARDSGRHAILSRLRNPFSAS